MTSPLDSVSALLEAARTLSDEVAAMGFSDPIRYVYNPLEYAWNGHRSYLNKAGQGSKKIVFLGMNPGPWGMAQNGVPFGEIEAVRGWMGLNETVGHPQPEHPKRPIEGFATTRSEVSGRRLWGLFQDRFGTAEKFFADHFVANYCPLVFMEESARNFTPDKLPVREKKPLLDACDRHLARILQILQPQWVIGVGAFAADCAAAVVERNALPVEVGRILHPSPASPAANRDWAGTATRQMQKLGAWPD